MAERPKTNLYTCWCGKPRNLEKWYCEAHAGLEKCRASEGKE